METTEILLTVYIFLFLLLCLCNKKKRNNDYIHHPIIINLDDNINLEENLENMDDSKPPLYEEIDM